MTGASVSASFAFRHRLWSLVGSAFFLKDIRKLGTQLGLFTFWYLPQRATETDVSRPESGAESKTSNDLLSWILFAFKEL